MFDTVIQKIKGGRYSGHSVHLFNGLFRTTSVSLYQKKSKTSLDLNEAKDYGILGWQWHQLVKTVKVAHT